MTLTIGEIFALLKEAKTRKDKVEILRKNDSRALREFLRLGFDPEVKFALPAGKIPYNKSDCPVAMGETNLTVELRRMYLFVSGGHPTLTQSRREELFLQLIEGLDPQEAELLELLVKKKLPNITLGAIQEAFPGFLVK